MERLSRFWFYYDFPIITGLLLGVIALSAAFILAPGYLPESNYQELPENCTAQNLEYRISQLDYIEQLPAQTYYSKGFRYPSSSLIRRNMQNVLRLRGCSASLNEALDNAGLSLVTLDFVNYHGWRAVLIAELHTLQQQERDQK